jgi:CHAT domain
LAELLDDHYPLRLVFLNSCEGAKGSESDAFSSTAATLVRRGIPAVVAMQYEITDKAAIEFSRDFYEAVAGPLIIASGVGVVLGIIEAGGMAQSIASLPEFLWELSLGVWLIVKGFNPSAAILSEPGTRDLKETGEKSLARA